ncbi:MAG TPA: divalent metal cation transporter [Planctomycetota bacterium]|nr:divalent metal cation transporter [Planctomycetota bacterium]
MTPHQHRDDQRPADPALGELRSGLRLGSAPSDDDIAREEARLRDLDARPPLRRFLGYMALGGPGYLQSAMTLGGGTAASALFAGAVFGYRLLWLAPVAMLLGVVMLAAVSWQTLSTGERPYLAMRTHASKGLALAWALGALFASIIWDVPQYSLASASLADLVDLAAGRADEATEPWPLAFPLLVVSVLTSLAYAHSRRALRLYERLLRVTVWLIVLCFASVVVLERARIDFAAVLRGFFSFEIPGTHVARDGSRIEGWELVLSGLSAAVGVNMVFLYPYSLLARGWGRAHRRLAIHDLLFGMLLPYVLATSLMIIATATTLHENAFEVGKSLAPLDAAKALEGIAGRSFARVALDLGFIGMALSSITLHMVCSGFACSELFGWRLGSKRHLLATLLPTPGVFGPLLWKDMGVYLAVPANVICMLFLPAAYIGFTILQAKKRYLGGDRPTGMLARLWLGAMVVISVVLLVLCCTYIARHFPSWWARL